MKILGFVVGLLLAGGTLASHSRAEVLFTFDPAPTFFVNSGIQPINVFANSTLVGGEVGAVLGADFVLGGGAVFNTPNAGTFGEVGFIGNGNINFLASSFDRDPTPALASTGYLNITFQNFAQTISNSRTPVATLLVNTNGLTAGTYSIFVTNGFFGGDVIADANSAFIAVPEPSSILLLGICFAGMYFRQSRARTSAAT